MQIYAFPGYSNFVEEMVIETLKDIFVHNIRTWIQHVGFKQLIFFFFLYNTNVNGTVGKIKK
jgi:hypothetical protein